MLETMAQIRDSHGNLMADCQRQTHMTYEYHTDLPPQDLTDIELDSIRAEWIKMHHERAPLMYHDCMCSMPTHHYDSEWDACGTRTYRREQKLRAKIKQFEKLYAKYIDGIKKQHTKTCRKWDCPEGGHRRELDDRYEREGRNQ